METMTYMELEGDNVKLRAEIAELRDLYTTALEKLGTVAGLLNFEPDKNLAVITDQIQIKLAEAELLTGASITAAAKWLEGYVLSLKLAELVEQIDEPKTPDSWQRFAHDSKGLIEALRRR